LNPLTKEPRTVKNRLKNEWLAFRAELRREQFTPWQETYCKACGKPCGAKFENAKDGLPKVVYHHGFKRDQIRELYFDPKNLFGIPSEKRCWLALLDLLDYLTRIATIKKKLPELWKYALQFKGKHRLFEE